MVLHLISAQRLGERLASGEVPPQEQAFYLSASFVLWALPTYLLIVPFPNTDVWPIPLGLWFYEGAALVMIYVFGVLYCLARCHVEPRQNFLIDFSCLYAPISLTTLVLVWGAFHIYASLLPWWLQKMAFDSPPRFFEFIYSARFFDLMRFSAFVSAVFVAFIRIGNCIEDVSKLRLSAKRTVDPDAQDGDARGSP
jgi:hypothetical protein